MDLLKTCKLFDLNPLITAIAEIDTNNFADTEVSGLAKLANADKTHRLYELNGKFMLSVLFEYNAASFNKHFGTVSSIDITVKQEQYKVETVYSRITSSPPAKQDTKPEHYKKMFTRKIKHFSGTDPVGQGECSVSEWLVLAQDVVDHDTKLTDREKLDYLRSTLIGDALQLLSSCLDSVQDGQCLINMIARTYGGELSCEQLEYEFRQKTQADREKPSLYWARLQQALVKWNKSSTTAKIDMDKLRFCQFVWGLCPTDSDLLGVRLNLSTMISTCDYPYYSKFLEQLQVIERERRERCCRAGNSKVRSGLVNVDEDNTELDKLKLKVAQLSVQQRQEVLEEQVQVANVNAATAFVPQNKSTVGNSKPVGDRQGQRPRGTRNKKPCWNCEALDHHLARCPADFDADRVKVNYQKFRDSKAKSKKPLN